MTNHGHVKGIAMNKPICGHISTSGGTGCIQGDGGTAVIKPDGDGASTMIYPDGNG